MAGRWHAAPRSTRSVAPEQAAAAVRRRACEVVRHCASGWRVKLVRARRAASSGRGVLAASDTAARRSKHARASQLVVLEPAQPKSMSIGQRAARSRRRARSRRAVTPVWCRAGISDEALARQLARARQRVLPIEIATHARACAELHVARRVTAAADASAVSAAAPREASRGASRRLPCARDERIRRRRARIQRRRRRGRAVSTSTRRSRPREGSRARRGGRRRPAVRHPRRQSSRTLTPRCTRGVARRRAACAAQADEEEDIEARRHAAQESTVRGRPPR